MRLAFAELVAAQVHALAAMVAASSSEQRFRIGTRGRTSITRPSMRGVAPAGPPARRSCGWPGNATTRCNSGALPPVASAARRSVCRAQLQRVIPLLRLRGEQPARSPTVTHLRRSSASCASPMRRPLSPARCSEAELVLPLSARTPADALRLQRMDQPQRVERGPSADCRRAIQIRRGRGNRVQAVAHGI